jgi:mannonate dehydratase
MKDNRRDFIKKGTSLAAALSLGAVGASAAVLKETVTPSAPAQKVAWPVVEEPDTPKMTMNVGLNDAMTKVRAIKQFGSDYVHMAGPTLPWTEAKIQAIIDKYKAEGLTIINMRINFARDIVSAGPGRDQEIKYFQDALRIAGKLGIPSIEYNFYAHRLTEGYYNVVGRGGSQYLGFDYNRKMANPADNKWNIPAGRSDDEMGLAPNELKPTAAEPALTKEQLWANFEYFLKAVIPVAEKAGVVMACHPNDPPPPVSRGSEQIMGSFKDWKKMLAIVDSPSNGMTYDCGVSTELGEDAIEVLHYMAARRRINHVHFRNVIVDTPRIKYVETFVDNGHVNMFAVMQELVRSKYKYGIFAEHPRGNEMDKLYGGDFIGYIYNQGYARGVLQSVLTLEQGYKA